MGPFDQKKGGAVKKREKMNQKSGEKVFKAKRGQSTGDELGEKKTGVLSQNKKNPLSAQKQDTL